MNLQGCLRAFQRTGTRHPFRVTHGELCSQREARLPPSMSDPKVRLPLSAFGPGVSPGSDVAASLLHGCSGFAEGVRCVPLTAFP